MRKNITEQRKVPPRDSTEHAQEYQEFHTVIQLLTGGGTIWDSFLN